MAIDALILAGAENTGKLSACSACDYEALIELDGQAMIRHVVSALRSAASVREVYVAGPVTELGSVLAQEDCRLVGGGKTLTETLTLGAAVMKDCERALIVTADVPLLTPEAVDGFVSLCGDRTADFYYPIVPREAMDRDYPGTRRTYVGLRDGSYTGGNVSLINPAVVDRCADRISEFVAARKSPLKLATILGLPFIVKFLSHMLTVSELEQKISALFELCAVAVVCPYTEVGIDVDKPVDLEFVSSVISSQRTGVGSE